jgi:hypothetical protein
MYAAHDAFRPGPSRQSSCSTFSRVGSSQGGAEGREPLILRECTGASVPGELSCERGLTRPGQPAGQNLFKSPDNLLPRDSRDRTWHGVFVRRPPGYVCVQKVP